MGEGSTNPEMANNLGPDLFSFYKHEIANLLTLDENPPISKSISSSTSLFSNSLEHSVPVFKRDLLKSSLRQSVRALAQEVDAMIDPVVRIGHILSCLSSKINKSSNGKTLVTRGLDSASPPRKKQKRRCSNGEDFLAEQSRARGANTETAADNEDLKLLLGSKISMVEKIMTKQSNEHYETLNHMELQLEELLGGVASKCRLMTRQEKLQLRKFIQELPPGNLDRLVEIIHHGKSSDMLSTDELVVNIEEQDNATLWRLYFYTRAVENARKLSK